MKNLNKDTLIEIEEFINTCRLMANSKKFLFSGKETSGQLIDTELLNNIKSFIGEENNFRYENNKKNKSEASGSNPEK